MNVTKRDEFDELAEGRHGGAHLRDRSVLAKVLPFILAITIAPLLAIGTVYAISHRGDSGPFNALDLPTPVSQSVTDEVTGPDEAIVSPEETETQSEEPTADQSAEPTPSEEASSEDSVEPSPEPSEDSVEPTEEPVEEGTPDADGIIRSASITILNGSATPGLEVEWAQRLMAEGYTNVSTGTYSFARPDRTTMYFANQDLYATAQNVSRTLVLDWWMESPQSTGGGDILIVIR